MTMEDESNEDDDQMTLQRAKQRYLGRGQHKDHTNKISNFSTDFPEPGSINSPLRSGALGIVGSTPRKSHLEDPLDRMLYENEILKNEVAHSVNEYHARLDHIRTRQNLMYQIRRETFEIQQRRRDFNKKKNELDRIKLTKANNNIQT